MKIIISASNHNLDQPFNPRFGRAEYFMLYDSETKEWKALQNSAINASGGAGTQAVQFIAQNGAEVVISGRFGPNAFIALEAAGAKAYVAKSGTVAEVLQQYLDGQLEQINQASGPGFHGSR